MSRSIKVDQVSDAFVSVPGDVVQALAFVPGGDLSTTSASFEDLTGANGSFVVSTNGTFLLSYQNDVYASAGATQVGFRLVIDAGTPSEKIIGSDDSTWRLWLDEAWEHQPGNFRAIVTGLVAGSHTIKVQWKRVTGAGTVTTSVASCHKVMMLGVSGSGAGGVIVTTAAPTAVSQVINTNHPTFTDITGLTLTINTSSGERVLIEGLADINMSGGAGSPILGMLVDGVAVSKYFETAPSLYELCASWSFMTEPLSAGSHTIKLAAAKQAADPSYTVYGTAGLGSGFLRVTQFRGGLVPWQKDGVAVLDTPRAINVIGGAMSMADDGTGVLDVELPTAVTGLGESRTLWKQVPGAVFTTTSSSWVDVDASIGGSFDIYKEGLYILSISLDMIISATGTTGRYRLVFDVGTGDEQIVIADDAEANFQVASAANRTWRTLLIPVTFKAGSHTVKPQWYREGGSATLSVTTGSCFKIVGTFVTGSGAGGVLTDEKHLVADYPYTNTGWEEVDNGGGDDLRLSFDTVEGEDVLVLVSARCTLAVVDKTASLQVKVDGTSLTSWKTTGTVSLAGGWAALTLAIPLRGLTAGTHTIIPEVYWTSTGSVTAVGSGVSVVRFRGGLVPIRKDGVTVLDKPQAFDFVGPGAQVTNVGGTAKVSLVGAEGVETQSAETAANQTVVATSISPLPTPLTLDFEANGGEVVFVGMEFNCTAVSGSANTYAQLFVDGVAASKMLRSGIVAGGSPTIAEMSDMVPYVIPVGSGTSHTLELRASTLTSTSWQIGASAKITVSRIKGGYVHPENVPILEYSSSSVVNVTKSPGAASELRMLLNDGQRYKAQSPLTVDLTKSGLGGIDTGTEAVSTWYYVYAVPGSISGYFDVLCSVTPPSTGPTGYSAWRYLGSIRNDSSGNIVKFYQTGSEFKYTKTVEPAASAALGTTLYTSAITLSLADVVPVTATMADLQGRIRRNASPEGMLLQVLSGYGLDAVGGFLANRTPAAGAYADQSSAYLRIPLGATKAIDYRSSQEVGSPTVSVQNVYCVGWIDSYLSGQESQLQAKYEPDSFAPQLSYSAAGAINVAGASGSASVIKLTLQDGKQRWFQGTLAWAFANGVADLGLDAGAEAASAWYYMYCVPKSSDDNQLTVRASVNPPTTGPTGYTNWRYLGAFRNDISGDIKTFTQQGSTFFYKDMQYRYNAGSAPFSEVAEDLSAYVPVTADKLSARLLAYQTAVRDSQYNFALKSESGVGKFYCQALPGECNEEVVTIPLITPQVLYSELIKVTGTNNLDWLTFGVHSWSDAYLPESGGGKLTYEKTNGALITVLEQIPTGTRTTTTTSWADVGTEFDKTFSVLASGLYALETILSVVMVGGSSETVARYRAIIDEGTPQEQTIGGGVPWEFVSNTASQRLQKVALDPVTLNAGDHTVVLQWQRVSGDRTPTVWGGDNFEIRGTLISGSGAGGLLTSKASADSIDISGTISPDAWQEITQLRTTIETTAEEVLILLTARALMPSSGSAYTYVKITIDDVISTFIANQVLALNQSHNLSHSFISPTLTAGSHVIKVWCAKASGDTDWRLHNGILSVGRLRGGLVPIRKDGAQVLDKPAAIDFTGPGCQVTNVDGTAKVSLVGADGAQPLQAQLSSAQVISAAPLAAIPSTPLTLSFYAEMGETVIAWYNAQTTMDQSTDSQSYFRMRINGSYIGTQQRTFTPNTRASYVNEYVPWTAPSSGYHTLELYAGQTVGNFTLTASTIIRIYRVKGGYVHPENIPILEYSSASQVSVKAAPGASSELRATLNDGKRYTATSPLTIDLTVSGRGGLDTGSEAVSTWYYAYLVPNAAGDGLSALCSVTPPSTGPTGYSIWKYLGAFRNDGSSNIVGFFQRGDTFFFKAPHTNGLIIDSGSVAPFAERSESLANVIPATADQVGLRIFMGATGTTSNFGFHCKAETGVHFLFAEANQGEANDLEAVLPIVTPQTCYTALARTSGSDNINWLAFFARRWRDKYLTGPQQALAPAPYTPDTASPKGTWVSGGVSVDFGPRPAKPSTSRLTLQDGVQRYMTTGTWAVANGVADWGYDEAASQGNSKWLYFYAVPKSGDDTQLVIRASDNAPATGPTGYTNFKLVWVSYMTSGATLRKVFQRGNEFLYTTQFNIAALINFAWSGSWIEYVIDDAVPLSCGSAVIEMGIRHVGTASDYQIALLVGPEGAAVDGGWLNYVYVRGLWDMSQLEARVPTPGTSTKKIAARNDDWGAGGSGELSNQEVVFKGWVDEWIDP